jgi:hypothetical protein
MAKLLMLLLLWIASGAVSAFAEDPMVLGARATGLGGAFTAVANDATAFYWNPAGVSQGPFVRVGVFGGSSYRDQGQLVEQLGSGRPGAGSNLDGDRAVGVSAGFTVFGVAVTRFRHTGSVLDDTVLSHQGLEIWDVAASFAQSLPLDDLVIGFNLHFLRGTARAGEEPAGAIPASEINVSDLAGRAVQFEGKTESEPGVDLGVQYRPREWIHLGLSARNLNRPTFHTERGDPISLAPHARFGVAFDLPRSVLLAADVDLSGRDGGIEQAEWRELAAGVEKSWMEGKLTLRGGLRTELIEGAFDRPGFSGGFAVKLGGVLAELGGMTSTRRRLGSLWLGLTFVI